MTATAHAQDVRVPVDDGDQTSAEADLQTEPAEPQGKPSEPAEPSEPSEPAEPSEPSEPAEPQSHPQVVPQPKLVGNPTQPLNRTDLDTETPPDEAPLQEQETATEPADEAPSQPPEPDVQAAPADESESDEPAEEEQPAAASEEEDTPAEEEQPAVTENEATEDRPPERSEPEVQPIPTEDMDEAPADESAAPAPDDDEQAAPADDEQAAPADDEQAAPADDEQAAPADDEQAAPADDEQAAPADDEQAAPADEEEAAAAPEEPQQIVTEMSGTPSMRIPGQMRAFWVDNNDPGMFTAQQVDELVNNALRANANTIIAQVRRHGDAMYNNALEPRFPGLPPAEEFDPLGYLIERAHAAGIEVHAWMVVSVVCEGSDQRGHPMHVCTQHGPGSGPVETWTTRTYSGHEVGEMDFGHPASVVHMETIVENMLTNYPTVDGIHWDFIRYGDGEYGYNAVSLSRFREAYNKPADYWPTPGDPEWSQWRRDRITELVRRLYIRSKAINPKIEVSAATITWGGVGSYGPGDWPNSVAFSRVFQDWRAWLEEGIIDFAVPMNYFDDGIERNRYWFDSWQDWNRANMGIRAIVPGLGSWLNTADQNISQIQRALATDTQGNRLSGVAFFDYNEPIYGTTHQRRLEFFDQLRATVFREPVPAPAWPWIENPTTGHMQGIAAIDGELLPGAEVWVIKGDTWVTDLVATYDGWFGMIELEPGSYTIIVHDPEDESNKIEYQIEIVPGQVTNVS
jgi:uncharacterized lipoprotein YddW (UPF0748 family)